MRGSPLIRFLILLPVLVLAGFGLTRVTNGKPPTPGNPDRSPGIPAENDQAAAASREFRYTVVLSAIASEVVLSANGWETRLEGPATTFRGTLSPPADAEFIVVRAKWVAVEANEGPPAARKFARINLAEAHRPTIERVFDSDGEIHDLIELPP